MTIFEVTLFGITLAPSYYGLMYALGFIFAYRIIKHRIFGAPLFPFGKREKTTHLLAKKQSEKNISHKKSSEYMDSLLFYIFFGVILGGRIGYVILYQFDYYSHHLIDILKVWEGGMSFHGGVIGVVIAMIAFSKKEQQSFYALSDEITATLPIGLFFGRIGNYLNKELLGFENYHGLWAVQIGEKSYFPSPLLEAFLEGILLFIILSIAYQKKRFHGQIASLFLILYASFRILVELFVRQPDESIGYIFSGVSLGTLYSLPMLLIGMYFYIRLGKK